MFPVGLGTVQQVEPFVHAAHPAHPTGAVADADCGVTHQMPGTSASCTLMCIKDGSDFALIVEDTAYTLETSNEELKAELEKLAGMMATITGDVTGETIVVASVTAAQ